MHALPIRMHRRPLPLATLALTLLATAAGAGEPPASLAALVLHPRSRPVLALELQGRAFEALRPFSALPYVAWPRDAGPAPFARDVDAVAAWLDRAAAELGHAGLSAEPAGGSTLRGDEVWEFQLMREGIAVRDATVGVHWRGERLVGLVNRLAQPIVGVEQPGGTATADLVYQPRPAPGGVELALARVQVEQQGGARVERVVSLAGATLSTRVHPAPPPASPGAGFAFTEYHVPTGSFPDQIGVDSTGEVWFSQPTEDLLGGFVPQSERFRRVVLPAGASGPDGLAIDAADRLWTGLYYAGGLGRYDIATGAFAHFPAPYPNPAMAIPTPVRDGHVWVTDHQANRISEFDPATQSWVVSYVMPSPSAWVVAGAEDTVSRRLYFTEYNVGRLAERAPGAAPTEIPVPSAGVAFCAVVDQVVYYSNWAAPRLGAYSIQTGQTVEYVFPESGEIGGPLARTPDGRIAVGTRNVGYIMVFDPQTATFGSYQIPTPFPALKDGLTVDRAGRIWFAESGVDRIARLELF